MTDRPYHFTPDQLRMAYAQQAQHSNPAIAEAARIRLAMLGGEFPGERPETAPAEDGDVFDDGGF